MSKLPEMPEALLGGDDGRRKLVSRAIVGAVLIAVLLGLLSYFEHVPGPADKEGSPVSTIPPIDGPVASGVATAGGDQPQMPERAPDEPPMVQQAALAVAAEPEESHGPEIAAPGERVADAPATTADARPAAPSKGGRLVLQGEAPAAEPDAAAFFDGLAQFYRRAYLRWIDATKRRPDLRAERIVEVVNLLKAGIKERPR